MTLLEGCQCVCDCNNKIVDRSRKFCTECDLEHRKRIRDRVFYGVRDK